MRCHRTCYRLYTKQVEHVTSRDGELNKKHAVETFMVHLHDEISNKHLVLWMKNVMKVYEDMQIKFDVATDVKTEI